MAHAQIEQPSTLRDGQAVALRGQLAAEFTGWQPHILLRVASRIRASDSANDSQDVREIEIAPSFHEVELSKHLGQSVMLEGKLQIAYESPYYWNGVMVLPATLSLPGGVVLRSAPERQDTVPGGVKEFLYSTTLRPKHVQPQVEAIDIATSAKIATVQDQNCGVSGGGEGGVANCGCPTGFVATKGYAGDHPVPVAELAAFADPDAPQLQVPEAAMRPLTMEILCMRKAASDR